MRNSLFVMALCSASVLAGCDEAAQLGIPTGAFTNSGSSSSVRSVSAGKTSEERALEKEVANLNRTTRNIVVKNILEGAAVGAAAGCVTAAVTDNSCGQGALIGGGLGAIFGASVGNKAANAKREIVQADQTIAKLKGIDSRLGGVEANLKAVLRSQNSEISSLRRQLAAGQATKSSVDARISAINNNRQTISARLQDSEKNLATEKAELVAAEKANGQKLSTTKRAVDSTSRRLRNLRGSVKQVSS